MAAPPVWSQGTSPRRRSRRGALRWMLTLTLCSRHPCCRCRWRWSRSGSHSSTRRGRARARRGRLRRGRASSAPRPPTSPRSGRPPPLTRSSGPSRQCSRRCRRAASSGRCSRTGTARTHRASSASDARAAQRHARHPRPYRRATDPTPATCRHRPRPGRHHRARPITCPALATDLRRSLPHAPPSRITGVERWGVGRAWLGGAGAAQAAGVVLRRWRAQQARPPRPRRRGRAQGHAPLPAQPAALPAEQIRVRS